MSVPSNERYRSMEPVASRWQQHNSLGEALVEGLRGAGNKIFSSGAMEMDLTQTSYSTVPVWTSSWEIRDPATLRIR